jgi:hypothetical protein
VADEAFGGYRRTCHKHWKVANAQVQATARQGRSPGTTG